VLAHPESACNHDSHPGVGNVDALVENTSGYEGAITTVAIALQKLNALTPSRLGGENRHEVFEPDRVGVLGANGCAVSATTDGR
jgi:hypothetical protein